MPLAIVAVARFLWPHRPAANMAKALNVPHFTARNWLCGYRRIPADKCQQLKTLIRLKISAWDAALDKTADANLFARETRQKALMEAGRDYRDNFNSKPVNL